MALENQLYIHAVRQRPTAARLINRFCFQLGFTRHNTQPGPRFRAGGPANRLPAMAPSPYTPASSTGAARHKADQRGQHRLEESYTA